MVEIRIGAGGWSYFNVPGERLYEYSKAFRMVEVNSTYYAIPSLSKAEDWRRRVTENFEFTVRCNQELTEKLELGLVEPSLEVFYHMKEICKVLKANILHIGTPSIFKLDGVVIETINNFLNRVGSENPRLAWEVRSLSSSSRDSLLRILEEHNVIHSTDLSRENPVFESDIVYARLFGKGERNVYQFTNKELYEIDREVRATRASKAYLSFHGTRMYKDAARISVYEATGKFPNVTSGIGVDSVLEVLNEDAYFPSTTSELIASQGWKVCEWRNDQQLHLSEILSRIEEKRFRSIHELRLELMKHDN